MFNLKTAFYLKLIFLISAVAIISAYYFEYILGYQPCNLCLIERIPYILSLVILSVNFKFNKNEKYLILLLFFIFIFSLIISIYHFGIEKGFIQESLLCNLKNGADILSKEVLLKELQKITVSCKDVTFRFLGFSLTTINIFVSLLLVFLLAKIFISYEKIKK
jgi:disulfide bond formation protein DsbB